jgi:hypothetical protein
MKPTTFGLVLTLCATAAPTADARQLTDRASFLEQTPSAAADLARVSMAAPPQATAQNEPRPVKITGGVDFPSLYVFRGIRQEADPQLTVQPFVNVAFIASPTVTVNAGSWNSFHSGSTNDALDDPYYESDFYVSGAFATGRLTTTALYTAYMSPNDAFKTVHELAFIAAVNDSENSVPVAPAVTVAFELGDNGADAGARKGIYLELAATPGIPLGDDAPLSLTVPVKLGLSLKDYYEHPGTGEDSTFGYFSGGLAGLVPLSPHFDIHGSLLFYGFGDALKAFNNDNGTQVVGSIGLGFSF